MDYELVPFHCQRCHEYGHLYKYFPIHQEEVQKKLQIENPEGFQKETTRKRNLRNQSSQPKETSIPTRNKYLVLNKRNAEEEIPEYLMNLDLNIEETQAKASSKRKALET